MMCRILILTTPMNAFDIVVQITPLHAYVITFMRLFLLCRWICCWCCCHCRLHHTVAIVSTHIWLHMHKCYDHTKRTSDRYGPHFEDIPTVGNVTNITVPIGNAVYLNCRISLLQDKTVCIFISSMKCCVVVVAVAFVWFFFFSKFILLAILHAIPDLMFILLISFRHLWWFFHFLRWIFPYCILA